MAIGKKSFILYSEWEELFETLTDTQAANLIRHIYRYVNDRDPELEDQSIAGVWAIIKPRLKADLEKWEGIREKRAQAGRKGGQAKQANASKSKQDLSNQAVSVNGSVNVSDTDILLEKETKISFDSFWNLYDKKVDRPKCESKWKRLSLEDRQAIMEYIPEYIKSQPDKKYRKNPLTFLNNRSWENELIHATEGDEYKTYTYNELLSLAQYQGRYKEFFRVVKKDHQGRAIFAHVDDIEKFKIEILT